MPLAIGLVLVSTLTIAAPVAASASTVRGWGASDQGQITIPAGLTDVKAVAAGWNYSLALNTDGTVVGWNAGGSGGAAVPPGLADVAAISAGAYHGLALKNDGTVVAWGSNYYGESSPPLGLSNVIGVAAGYSHSLAARSDGSVVGWGSTQYGAETPPPGLMGVTAVAAGTNHSLAMKSDGTVVAWGLNLGGSTDVPAGLADVVAIAAGNYWNLALKADGTVVAWGDNAYGEATPPTGLSNVTAISAGVAHGLALKADGNVVAWGYNDDGRASIPAGLSGVTAIAAGGHSLAVLSRQTGSLEGEVLAGFNGLLDPTGDPPPASDCPNVPINGRITYSWTTSGPADNNPEVPQTLARYPGTFTESGALEVGNFVNVQPGVKRGQILAASIDFTILSGDTTITGHKWLSPGAVADFTCGNYLEGTHQSYIRSFNLANQLGYSAAISAPEGTLKDAGAASIQYDKNEYFAPVPGVFRSSAARFREFFVSSGPPTDNVPPVVSGSPDRAPNGNGWYQSNVTVTWTSTDPSPSSGTPSTVPQTFASTEGAGVIYHSYPSCDPAGNCTTGQIQLSIDKVPPVVVTPAVRFVLNQPIAVAPALKADWAGSGDATSGIAGYSLRYTTNGACCTSLSAGTATTKVTPELVLGKSYTFSVRATDLAGWTTDSAFTSILKIAAFDDPKSAGWVTYSPTGAWTASKPASAYNGTLTTTSTLNATAIFNFKGSQVAFVAPTSPTSGSVRIYLDGTLAATVSLQSVSVARQVVFVHSFAVSGNHIVKVESAGGGPVSVDAFFGIK